MAEELNRDEAQELRDAPAERLEAGELRGRGADAQPDPERASAGDDAKPSRPDVTNESSPPDAQRETSAVELTPISAPESDGHDTSGLEQDTTPI